MGRDLIAVAREIRNELRGIRRALEAANANDPIEAMSAALARQSDESMLVGLGRPTTITGDIGTDADMSFVGGSLPPEESWRLG